MQNMRLVKKDKPEFFSLFLPSVFLVKKQPCLMDFDINKANNMLRLIKNILNWYFLSKMIDAFSIIEK